MIKIKRFGFFNSINGDRKYLATDISNALNVAIGTGLAPIEDSFKIVPNQNMTIKMKPGGAIIFGHYCFDSEDEVIQLDTANSELNRVDRVVLRYDKFERNIKTVVIKGTPALNPTPPASLKTENQFDLVLADVRVDKAITEIKQINDMRDSDLCGYLGNKVLEKNIFGAIQSLGTNGYRVFPGGLKIVKGFYKTPQVGGSDGVNNGAYYKIISNLKLPITFDDKESMQVFANSTTAWTWANGTAASQNGISLIVSNISSAQVNANTGISYFVIGN